MVQPAKNSACRVTVVTRQGTNVVLYGPSPDINLSGEIGRRERDGARLDCFLQIVRNIVGVLGPAHFALSVEQDETGTPNSLRC